ncbi:siroheme decarboxylase subunit alpha [Syntrophomonas erecta]
MKELSKIDRDILDRLQNDFLPHPQPFKEIANQIGIDESLVLERVNYLKKSGIIRRIGAIIDSSKLGYYSTLCACQVPEDKVEQVADCINQLPGVTHNYLRDHPWNIWFTLTAPSQKEIRQILSRLEEKTGVKIVAMPAKKTYKIKVALEMGDNYDHR